MPVERIYIAHIKGCNINLKKYGAPSYRQVKLFPQADNYRLGVSKSYQPLSTLSPCIETGSRYIVDIFYCSHFLDCTLDIALCSPVLTMAIVLHSGMAMDRSYLRTHENTFSDFGRDGCQKRRQEAKSSVHSSSISNIGEFQHPTQILQSGPLFLREQGRLGQPRHLHRDGNDLRLGWAEMGLLGPWASWGSW